MGVKEKNRKARGKSYRAKKQERKVMIANYESKKTLDNFIDAKIRKNNRRAEKKGSVADLQKEEYLLALDLWGGMCGYCWERPGTTLEHIEPIVKGGATTACNCIPACSNCNSSKGEKDLEIWYPEQKNYSDGKMEILNIYISETQTTSIQL